MRRVVLSLLALLAAAGVAVAAWVLAALLRPGLIALGVIALVAFLLSGHLLLGMAQRGSEGDTARDPVRNRRLRLAWLIMGALLYVGVAQLTVGRAPARTLEPLQPVGDLGTWVLGDGSRLAFRHVAPEGEGGPGDPVIFLHGGPGVPILPSLGPPGSGPVDFLAEVGHPVYYYDQRGAGFSDRLDLTRDPPYSVALHVADLEAIRLEIGADRVVLVGHGWGASLAAQYLLAHPEKVTRLVALSPAPLWYPAHPDLVEPSARARLTDVQASALALLERPTLRLLVGRLTAGTSRSAAHTLVSDWEADQWWTRMSEESMRFRQPNLTCSARAQERLPSPTGLGYFAYSYSLEDALRLPDPRPALSRIQVPVLVIRGFCDYIRWQVAYEYLQLLPDARQVSASASGHLVWVEQPEVLETLLLPFLAGEHVPLAFYHPERRGGEERSRP